jgi:hypothetical protein
VLRQWKAPLQLFARLFFLCSFANTERSLAAGGVSGDGEGTRKPAGTRTAQAILGHTTEAMTSACIHHKTGKKVRPIC